MDNARSYFCSELIVSLNRIKVIVLLLFSTLLFGCALPNPARESLTRIDPVESIIFIPSTGNAPYFIQIGAFSDLEKAMSIEKTLRSQGLDAYCYRHESGLYKVCIGDYSTFEDARTEGASLQKKGLFDEFLIVQPEDYALFDVRRELVETATRFIGVPYIRGGKSAEEGFDCSGLTMTVYHLNGLKLPRESARQFRVGRHVERHDLQRGDLVFFAIDGGPRVSHVGLYIGEDKFIHAPRPGKTVRIASLDSVYFKKRYVGGRSYF